MKVYNMFNVHTRPCSEPPEEPEISMTVPDQAMSLQEILARYVRGQEIPRGPMAYYDEPGEDSSGINPRTLDLAELQEIREDSRSTIEKIQKQRDAKLEKDRQNAERQRIRSEMEAEQKELSEKQKVTDVP